MHLIRYAQSENEGWDIRRGKSFMNILVKFVVPIQIVAQVQTNPGEKTSGRVCLEGGFDAPPTGTLSLR